MRRACIVTAAALMAASCDKDQNQESGPGAAIADLQVLTALMTANQNGLDEARIAQMRATTPAVRAYANQLVAAHTAALARENALAPQLPGTGSMGSDVNDTLRTEGAATMQQLQAASSSDFDRVFVCAQLRTQTAVAQVVTTQLPKKEPEPPLDPELNAVGANAAQQLQTAQTVASVLAGNATVDVMCAPFGGP
jgi:predicted outer membrane protein